MDPTILKMLVMLMGKPERGGVPAPIDNQKQQGPIAPKPLAGPAGLQQAAARRTEKNLGEVSE